MTLGEKIAKQRKENNYTQEQLADILGVSRQSVSKWESDIAYPETDKLIKLGKLFDCSMDYLLNEDCTDRSGRIRMKSYPYWIRYIPTIKRQMQGKEKRKNSLRLCRCITSGEMQGDFFAIGLKARGVFAVGLRGAGHGVPRLAFAWLHIHRGYCPSV